MYGHLMEIAIQARRVVDRVSAGVNLRSDHDNRGADRGTQIALTLAYQDRLASGRALPALTDVEFRNTAQQGEDGILLFIFALAGHGSRRAVEMCAGNGIECNSANLILHHGWDALLLDGNPRNIETGKQFYAKHFETRRVSPRLRRAWITVDNAQQLVDDHGFGDNLDFLSLDMDGVDYWIMQALGVRPRVIVCEYNNRLPAGMRITVPHVKKFAVEGDQGFGEGYFGASLGAFVSLLQPRGYRLVGANRHNTNAFFLRDDILGNVLPAVTEESCLCSRWAVTQRERWWKSLQSKPWIAV